MLTPKDSRAANEVHGAQTGLFVLALLYTIYFARPLLLPLTLGLILDFLFRPVVRRLKRWRLPEPAGAALVILALVAGPQERSRAGEIAREIEKQVSRYLYASTGINVVFGVVTALAMHLLGLPNALLWGVVAGLTAFIPYLGGLIAAALIGMAGLLTFTNTSPVVTIVLV